MACGIYAITNNQDGKSYIGGTINIKRRWNNHKSLLKRKKHGNIHLQSIYNEHGEDVFSYRILEECQEDYLEERETHWINKLNTTDIKYGYNIAIDVTAPMKGREFSEEHKKVVIESFQKYKEKIKLEGVPVKTKKKMSKSHMKYTHLVNTWKDLFREGLSCREIGRRYNLH